VNLIMGRIKSKVAADEKPNTSSVEEKNYDDDGATVRRLDAIIRLLIEQQLADKSLQKKDHVLILDSVGMSSREIGTILGQPSKDIASWIKRLKAGKS
jgi:hypothetical protein